jgi:chaperonin GroEL
MLHSIRFEEPVATDSPSADPRVSSYDAQSSEYKDMVKAGIIGPIKVMRAALQDAASVAGLLITTVGMVRRLGTRPTA